MTNCTCGNELAEIGTAACRAIDRGLADDPAAQRFVEVPQAKCEHPYFLRIGSADTLGRITSKCGACGETLVDVTAPAPVMPLFGPPRHAQPAPAAPQPCPTCHGTESMMGERDPGATYPCPTCQPQPAQTELTTAKPLPVPWEDVWVSSSDGVWTFDKVVEHKGLGGEHFKTAAHGIMTRKSEGWLWDYFDVKTTKNDRVYKPALQIGCPKCQNADFDERGNCYRCLELANKPAPQPGEVTTENLWQELLNWGMDQDPAGATGYSVADAVRDAGIADIRSNMAPLQHHIELLLATLERERVEHAQERANLQAKVPRLEAERVELERLRDQLWARVKTAEELIAERCDDARYEKHRPKPNDKKGK